MFKGGDRPLKAIPNSSLGGAQKNAAFEGLVCGEPLSAQDRCVFGTP